jgi:hypothetical protein
VQIELGESQTWFLSTTQTSPVFEWELHLFVLFLKCKITKKFKFDDIQALKMGNLISFATL